MVMAALLVAVAVGAVARSDPAAVVVTLVEASLALTHTKLLHKRGERRQLLRGALQASEAIFQTLGTVVRRYADGQQRAVDRV